MLAALKPQGAFAFYATWNLVGWWLVLLFLPETKGKTLEELDQVFNVRTQDQAAYGLRQIPYFFKRYVFRRRVEPPDLYAVGDAESIRCAEEEDKEIV